MRRLLWLRIGLEKGVSDMTPDSFVAVQLRLMPDGSVQVERPEVLEAWMAKHNKALEFMDCTEVTPDVILGE